MRNALVCDLDGTLVDSVADLAVALNRLLAEHALPPLTNGQVRGMVGRGVPTLVARAFAASDEPVEEAELPSRTRRFLDFYEGAETVHTRPYPQVPETLEALSAEGWRIAVCTNKPQAATEAILEALDLARFVEVSVGGDRVPACKPDGGHVRAVLAALDPPDGAALQGRAVMLGDSRSDVLAAHEAGLPCVLVSHGYGEAAADTLGAEHVIDCVSEVRRLLPTLIQV